MGAVAGVAASDAATRKPAITLNSRLHTASAARPIDLGSSSESSVNTPAVIWYAQKAGSYSPSATESSLRDPDGYYIIISALDAALMAQ
jgi:hypothetical protein